MKPINFYREKFIDYLNTQVLAQEPKTLYDPIVYILNLGGKRLRPISVLMTAELFGCSYEKALDAALAIEVFHNFSLVHDDIMDDAAVRRGKTTVHEKWDINTGILSGDAMLIRAYQLFENYEGETFRELAKLFSSTAIMVCEGQQYDVDFEEQEEVSLEEYLKMIEYKTAVLVGAAMEMGAIVAGADQKCRKQIYEYGCLLGLAFQLQDDYLDIFGDYETFGKEIGGDIIENKKTFLYLTALKKASADEAKQLAYLYSLNPEDTTQKVETVTTIFKNSGIAEITQAKIKEISLQAFKVLEEMEIPEKNKAIFREFGKKLMNREN